MIAMIATSPVRQVPVIDDYVRLIARLDDVIDSLVRLMFEYDTPLAREKLLRGIDRHLDHRLRLMKKRDFYV